MKAWWSSLSICDRLLWLCFAITCLHLTTNFPHLAIIAGERTKVFSGLFCACSFALLLNCRGFGGGFKKEWTIALLLSCICFISGFVSDSPVSSLWRGTTLIASSLGGYWCGRMLFQSSNSLRRFGDFALALYLLLVLLGAVGYIFWSNVLFLVSIHKHQLNSLLMLLACGPISLFFRGRPWLAWAGAVALLAGWAVMAMSFDPLIWFPPLLFIAWFLIAAKNKKRLLVPLFLVFGLVAMFQHSNLPEHFFQKNGLSAWLRIENVFFSAHMAKKHPWLGIGLVAPRLPYLKDYQVVYPYTPRKEFAKILPTENRSSENQILTFLCDLGIPFTVLYVVTVGSLYFRLSRRLWLHLTRNDQQLFTLWLPLTGVFFHLQFYDGLLQPNISWFVHLLLGISVSTTSTLYHVSDKEAHPARQTTGTVSAQSRLKETGHD